MTNFVRHTVAVADTRRADAMRGTVAHAGMDDRYKHRVIQSLALKVL